MNTEIKCGDIVKSLSGHDKNHLFLVVSIDKFGFVDIIDGRYRKLGEPKHKNSKHVQWIAHDEKLLDIINTPTITNAELHKLINSYKK